MATVAAPGMASAPVESSASVENETVEQTEQGTLTSAKQVAELFGLAFIALVFNVACVAVAAFL